MKEFVDRLSSACARGQQFVKSIRWKRPGLCFVEQTVYSMGISKGVVLLQFESQHHLRVNLR